MREGYTEWQVNITQSVLGKTFAPFGLISGRVFQEFDLVHLHRNLLFWGDTWTVAVSTASRTGPQTSRFRSPAVNAREQEQG
jgi:hypothetical protein